MSCGADRFVPLPAATLSGLRRHWRTHRHPRLIFPALGRGRNRAAAADCQAVPSAEASIEYLAPYVFKVAISDHRILSFTEGCVRFSYQKSGSTRRRVMTLDALEFIRRFLQHVLPTGFMKVLLRLSLTHCQNALGDARRQGGAGLGLHLSIPEVALAPWPTPACAACGGRLRIYRSLRARSTPPENGLGLSSTQSPAMSP